MDLQIIIPVVLGLIGGLGILARLMGAKSQRKEIREQHDVDRVALRQATQTWSGALDKQTTMRVDEDLKPIDLALAAVVGSDPTGDAADMWNK